MRRTTSIERGDDDGSGDTDVPAGPAAIYKPALRLDATRRVAAEAVEQALGHAPEALVAVPGGERGARVCVTLSAADAVARGAIEAALGAYLFESTVDVAGGRLDHATPD